MLSLPPPKNRQLLLSWTPGQRRLCAFGMNHNLQMIRSTLLTLLQEGGETDAEKETSIYSCIKD